MASKNWILTGHIEGKRDRGKQHITYLLNLCKWMAEQVLGEIAKRQFIKSYKVQEIVDSYDCLYPEGTWNIEDKQKMTNTGTI